MDNILQSKTYKNLLADIKNKIHQSQVRAVVAVNQELLLLYWEVGKIIVERQQKEGWGANVINQLSKDLKKAFPNMKGYSPRNLSYMKRFAKTYPALTNLQVPLAKISWYHNITLLQKCKDEEERFWYAGKALQNGWSRNVMLHQIETDLYNRQGKAVTNFSATLPAPQSDMAQQALKDLTEEEKLKE